MYFFVQICENGHVSTSYKRLKEGQVCDKCGAPMIETCPECGKFIQRWSYYGSVPTCSKEKTYVRPDDCPHCGAAFPWKEK